MPGQQDPVPRGRIRRTMPLAGFTARATGGRIVAGALRRAGDDKALDRFHERTAERYVELLGHSKGALMKAGQILSMIDASTFGSGGFAPYQKALSRLQADAPPMDPVLARAVLKAELGCPAEKLFTAFADEPMAAASIGQVHRAVLHDGREVAVKIQYPGVAQAIRDDLANVELIASFLRFVTAASGMRANVQALAREVNARLNEELDYRHEATMITTFADLYRGHPFIRIPDVVPELSADRVLTMSFVHGMDWAAAQQADQELKNTWAEAIFRFSAANYRHSNLLHADPHPGNYRFRPDGTVGFLDFGCVRVLPELQRRLFVTMVRATFDGRIHDMREAMAEMGFLDADPSLTAAELYQWWQELLHEMILADHPVTYNQETIDRSLRIMYDTRAPDTVLARLTLVESFSLGGRIWLALIAIAGGLGATLLFRAIYDDMDSVAEPVTALGRAHHAWLRDRGLPTALEPQ